MDERECQAVYQQLVSMLREIEMNWVVQLAAEEISAGTIVRQNTSDLAVREYTPKERLKILISIIKQSIVDTTLMEESVFKFFANNEYFANLNPSLKFTSDTDEVNLNINNDDSLSSRVEEANNLLGLLERITEVIGDEAER